MISRIDLTEHNDFAHSEIPIGIDSFILQKTSRLYNVTNVNLNDDFRIIEIAERVFGKTFNIVSTDLFHLEDYRKQWGICDCCGGKIIPWKSRYYTSITNCHRCDTVQKASVIPWTRTLNRRLPSEIFNLR